MINPWLIYIAAARFYRKEDAIYEDASHQCVTAMAMTMWIAGREDDDATMMHGSVPTMHRSLGRMWQPRCSGSSGHRSWQGKRNERKDQYVQEL